MFLIQKKLADFIFKIETDFMDDQQFRQLLSYLGFSWSGYRKVRKGVKKRISRHMQQLGCRNMAAYLKELDRDYQVRQRCEQLMTVSISRFFRDRNFWKTLEKKLLPDLIEKQPEKVKVWSAGCAGGDEVYSFMMVWDALKKKQMHMPQLEVLATDMNPEYLERARSGVYSAGSLKELSPQMRSLYFKKIGGKNFYAVEASIGHNVFWKIHHLLSDPPGSDFDIIFLRNNVLTYYEDRLKKATFKKVFESLVPKGLLIIGSHEALPLETEDLVRLAPHPFVFQKR